jgi:aspartate racemase
MMKNTPDLNADANEKMIGIIGGVGPEAGTLAHRFVIEATGEHKTISSDQDHLMVQHISASPWIEDRTKYLKDASLENPAEGAAKVTEILSMTARAIDRQCVAGVPCNTFHSPPIFNRFLQLLQQKDINNVEVLHMVEETINYIQKHHAGIERIGLMSTTGTREQRLYQNLLERNSLGVVQVSEEEQAELHDTIYNGEWGIKAVSPVSEKARRNFEKYAQLLKDQGAEAIILGCTEIPLALPGSSFEKTPLIDPMRALGDSLVQNALRKVNHHIDRKSDQPVTGAMLSECQNTGFKRDLPF